jgi:hypothetical protein
MADEKPVGKRYSQIYEEPGVPTDDDATLRGRLGHFIANQAAASTYRITSILREEMGEPVYLSSIVEFFEGCTLRKLRDSISCIAEGLANTPSREVLPPSKWIAFVQKAFKEENVAYTVDEKGGVHPAFDETFDHDRRATIALLGMPRYAAARKFFDEAIADLKQPRDTRDAVRKTFDAVENVAKQMLKVARLTANEVKGPLRTVACNGLEGTTRDATNRMIESFAEWVNGCQQYRHAAGEPEPDEPSLDLAILMVSTGAAHLRWLIGVDQAALARQ